VAIMGILVILLDVGLGWSRDQLVENALRVFKHEFDNYWGPRISHQVCGQPPRSSGSPEPPSTKWSRTPFASAQPLANPGNRLTNASSETLVIMPAPYGPAVIERFSQIAQSGSVVAPPAVTVVPMVSPVVPDVTGGAAGSCTAAGNCWCMLPPLSW
jgi:hypothetical protein